MLIFCKDLMGFVFEKWVFDNLVNMFFVFILFLGIVNSF